MKKVIILLLTVALFSSCASQRGVQFYSGDKNNEVLASNIELASQKRLDLQSQIFRLQRERDVVVMRIDRDESRDISLKEAEIRRLETELLRLTAAQRGESNLLEYEQKASQLENKKAELIEIKKSSEAYQSSVVPLDNKIVQLEGLLFDLELAETQALTNNLAESNLDYFEANLKSGYEAANAYSLIKWSQKQAPEEDAFKGIIINNRSQSIIITIAHPNGWIAVYDLAPETILEVAVPFPGDYTVKSKYSNTIKLGKTNVRPSKKVFHQGKPYFFRILQT